MVGLQDFFNIAKTNGFEVSDNQRCRPSIIKKHDELRRYPKESIRVYTLVYKYETMCGSYIVHLVTISGNIYGLLTTDSYTGNRDEAIYRINSSSDLGMSFRTILDIIMLNEMDIEGNF